MNYDVPDEDERLPESWDRPVSISMKIAGVALILAMLVETVVLVRALLHI